MRDSAPLRSVALWLLGLCAALFLLTTPGRITFPDDEIVFQTTQSLAERGEFAVAGMPMRTGEPPGVAAGHFGTAEGADGRRYGFFGHGLSLAAVPSYWVGDALEPHVPETWKRAARRDLFRFHRGDAREDWLRLVVSLTNCLIAALAVALTFIWLRTEGFSQRAAAWTALLAGLGTTMWTYAGTMLSEPLSACMLLGAAALVRRFHTSCDPKALIGAAAIMGLSVHVHVLNVVAVPVYIAYAMWPLRRANRLARHKRTLILAVLAGAAGLVLLGISQWVRFANPLETGRQGQYSKFMVPLRSLPGLLISPGRSFFLYAPACLLGIPALRVAWREHRDVMLFCLLLIGSRLLFVACRTDWYGGWGLGPRYLAAVIPFAFIPVATVLESLRRRPRSWRIGWWTGAAITIAIGGFWAVHSIFEWMWTLLAAEGPVSYLRNSHWRVGAAPLLGYMQLEAPAARALAAGNAREGLALVKFDTLSFAALRLALMGHRGLLWCFAAVVCVGTACGVLLHRSSRLAPRGRSSEPSRDGQTG